jgi:hypothetical protein
MTNENNYLGATTTLVGYASGEARTPRYDKDGSSGVLEVSFALNEGYKKGDEFIQTGTTWYTYSAAGDYADPLRAIGKGDKVRINDAKQEVREYENKDGEKVKAIGLRYGSIVVLEKSNRGDGGDGFTPTGGGGGF